ncbi:hypothetical protein Nepgr_000336 [Nepenthes gracilis]|uniref:Uncharacterized protein n=1 Tax=Nepenthes gracilis TaxID=150966 RepID=A0AAD3P3P2_NEPGR|nr:hypothetical protein Nepgr_000336 [Nepenthes gracilis]
MLETITRQPLFLGGGGGDGCAWDAFDPRGMPVHDDTWHLRVHSSQSISLQFSGHLYLSSSIGFTRGAFLSPRSGAVVDFKQDLQVLWPGVVRSTS